MGLPSVITTDQGSVFRNTMNKELMRQLDIEHRLTSPNHPQANGLDERFNQTISRALAKLAADCHSEWEYYLSEVVYGYNSAIHVRNLHTHKQCGNIQYIRQQCYSC